MKFGHRRSIIIPTLSPGEVGNPEAEFKKFELRLKFKPALN